MHEIEKWKWSCSVVSDSSRPRGLQPTRLLNLHWYIQCFPQPHGVFMNYITVKLSNKTLIYWRPRLIFSKLTSNSHFWLCPKHGQKSMVFQIMQPALGRNSPGPTRYNGNSRHPVFEYTLQLSYCIILETKSSPQNVHSLMQKKKKKNKDTKPKMIMRKKINISIFKVKSLYLY